MSDLVALLKKLKRECGLKEITLEHYDSGDYAIDVPMEDYVIIGVIDILDKNGKCILWIDAGETVRHCLRKLKPEVRDTVAYTLKRVDDRAWLSAVPPVKRRKS